MNSVNRVYILGNCTANPEVKETANGQKVATVSVATNRTWKDENGEKQERVEFHNIVFWRGLADIVEKYVKKGNKIHLSGYLQTRSWEAEDGSKRYKTEIVAEDMVMLSQKKESEPEPEYDGEPEKKRTKRPKPGDEEMHIEDFPF